MMRLIYFIAVLFAFILASLPLTGCKPQVVDFGLGDVDANGDVVFMQVWRVTVDGVVTDYSTDRYTCNSADSSLYNASGGQVMNADNTPVACDPNQPTRFHWTAEDNDIPLVNG